MDSEAFLKNRGEKNHKDLRASLTGLLVGLGVLLSSGPACLLTECAPGDVSCNIGALLLYTERDCNLTHSLAVGAFRQTDYVKASNADTNDFFGNGGLVFDCVTETLVVSTISESSNATGINGNQADNSAANSGAAYVFRYTNGVLAQEAYIKASNAQAGDAFGRAIALSGDTLVVGADAEASNATGVNGTQTDNTAAGAGAVYVFRRGATGWSQEAYVKASNTEASDGFGQSLALAGDVLVVGATGEDSAANSVNGGQTDNSALNAGAVYVFRRSGTNWAQEAYLKASNTNANDSFGRAIAIYGDVIGVGAPAEGSNATGVNGNESDNSAGSAGAVYLFRNSGNSWSQDFYVKASNTDAGDNFGDGLSISEGVMAVAASQESGNATGVNGN
ncbi:MAG: FG-GAP repeat protein, partial [Leptospirales bacterium]